MSLFCVKMKHEIQPKIFYLSVFIYNLYIINADILLIFNANIFMASPFEYTLHLLRNNS